MSSGLGTIVTADQLSARNYPPTDFLVDRLIPKGVALLAGEPKAGKPWLALDVAASIARGVVASAKGVVRQAMFCIWLWKTTKPAFTAD
ncbi:hypothetical protein ASE63_25585 [Bosea sp. Root381]|uniref:AAA family ATPase n=1 Tax=Bosea sp. Root381 TaxID=1736524 RepID=UPI0006F2A63C|nr:AAA family ATPase [Bosea sp. Root381]KRE04392.1 hypothetical protein ASE63_25585 [Bosea sp. Root381]